MKHSSDKLCLVGQIPSLRWLGILLPGVNDFLAGDMCERKLLTVACRAPVLRSRSVPITTKVDAVKKRRPNWRPLRWKLLWGSSEQLERGLDGAQRPRVAAMSIETLLDEALVLIIVRIPVADISRPVLQETKGQASIPIRVVVGNLVERLESELAADGGREEIPQLPFEGIAKRSIDRIRLAECLEEIWRPIVVDGKRPLAASPRRTALHLEIADIVERYSIPKCKPKGCRRSGRIRAVPQVADSCW
jgi:hypothetical protein